MDMPSDVIRIWKGTFHNIVKRLSHIQAYAGTVSDGDDHDHDYGSGNSSSVGSHSHTK